MKFSAKIARIVLLILVLFLIGLLAGCGEPLDATQPSTCRPCGNAIYCEISLDACIVEGHGSCDADCADTNAHRSFTKEEAQKIEAEGRVVYDRTLKECMATSAR